MMTAEGRGRPGKTAQQDVSQEVFSLQADVVALPAAAQLLEQRAIYLYRPSRVIPSFRAVAAAVRRIIQASTRRMLARNESSLTVGFGTGAATASWL